MRSVSIVLLTTLLSSPAFATSQTVSANFNVTITILKQCSVTAPATINLGSVGANDLIATTTSSTQTYTVSCSRGTGYTIGFSSANDVSAGSATHQMKGTGSNTDVVQYNLFDATTGSTVPLDASMHVISDTGTGTSQTKSLKAQVVNYTSAVGPDTYTDTVTMTVTY